MSGAVSRLEGTLSNLREALGIRPRVTLAPVPGGGRVILQSEWGLKLGELSRALSSLGSLPVVYEEAGLFPGHPDSYRGYYEDLALSRDSVTPCTAAELGRRLARAIGETFCGYKGGEFTMHEQTTTWSADSGDSTGLRITGVVAYDDRVVLTTGREA